MANRTHALYRFFNADGELLYVGITMNPGARWPKHRSDKLWWTEVETITLESYESRAEVLLAETEAIKTEHPLYNIQQAAPVQQPLPPSTAPLTWHCDDCGNAVRDFGGLVGIRSSELLRYRQEMDVWETERLADDRLSLPVALLMTVPELAAWQVLHFDCDAESLDAYSFTVDRLRTPMLLLTVTAHLMTKRWLRDTDWRSVIVEACAGER